MFSDEDVFTDPEVNKTYSSISGFATTVNYIIGTGVFGIPLAFYAAGIPLATIILILFFYLVSSHVNSSREFVALCHALLGVIKNEGKLAGAAFCDIVVA